MMKMMMMKMPVHRHLHGDDDDLDQLQHQLVWFAALGVVFITRAHKEVLQLPAQGLFLRHVLLLLHLSPQRRPLEVQRGPDPLTSIAEVNGTGVKGHRGQQSLFL